MDDSKEDQRLPHRLEPNKPVSVEELRALGLLYFHFDLDGPEAVWRAELDAVRKERGYSYEDVCDIHKDRLPNYETKLVSFFTEHIHTDEEIRLVADGSGYFDVRDKEDRWIRIAVFKGDLLILPAGIYHRFTLDTNNYIKAMRFFVGEPVWTPYNRPADDMKARVDYVRTVISATDADVEEGKDGAAEGGGGGGSSA